MSRCMSCNHILNKQELEATNPYSGQPEDLCRTCLAAVYTYDEPIISIDPDLVEESDELLYEKAFDREFIDYDSEDFEDL